ncbi:hypothetical protein M2138_000116 [Dysgonomonadaceae bacterium PH5-43]|nr:hypothetical protein [Dysgonomonadaceae bacterium PH5-43]
MNIISMKKYSLLFVVALIIVSCNDEEKAAKELLNEAKALYENTEYGSAKLKLDKIKEDYPKELEIRKEALSLNREIEIKEQQRNIAYCDSMIIVRNKEAKAMLPQFAFVKTEYDNVGRYYYKEFNPQPNYTAARYINVHVNERNDLVLTSVYKGNAIGHNQIKAYISSGEYATTEKIPNDKAANYSFTDALGTTYETVTYQNGRDNGVLAFIGTYADKNITIDFIGKQTVTHTLSNKEKQAVLHTVKFYTIKEDVKQFEKEIAKAKDRLWYLERKVNVVSAEQ